MVTEFEVQYGLWEAHTGFDGLRLHNEIYNLVIQCETESSRQLCFLLKEDC